MLDQKQITDYFLGQLSANDAERVEEACLHDQTFAESVFLIEEDLIDRYVRHELTPDEEERFEQVYLTTVARHSRVDVARALISGVEPTVGKKAVSAAHEEFHRKGWVTTIFGARVPRLAFATVLLAASLIALWLFLRNQPSESITSTNRPANVAATPEPTQGVTTSAVTPTPHAANPDKRPTPSPVQFAVFTLRAGAVRGTSATEQVIKVASQAAYVELRLVLQDRADQAYNVRIETAEGEGVLERRDVKASSFNEDHILTIRVPASRLEARDYIARVFQSGGESAASYSFRVTKQP